jgi:hypothetical protein
MRLPRTLRRVSLQPRRHNTLMTARLHSTMHTHRSVPIAVQRCKRYSRPEYCIISEEQSHCFWCRETTESWCSHHTSSPEEMPRSKFRRAVSWRYNKCFWSPVNISAYSESRYCICYDGNATTYSG